MHPASSIILFTTASGLGYGLLFVLGLFTAFAEPAPSATFGFVALAIALGTVTVGLLSSTFHLGHPERAWRAVSQWRSSWLSREGVMALVTYLPAAWYGIGWVFFDTQVAGWQFSGVVTALGAVLTVVCTSMIYASLKAIPRWHNKLVPATYLLFALMSGLVWLDALLRVFGQGSETVTLLSSICIVVTLLTKRAYWLATDSAPPQATIGSATGLGGNGNVRLLEPPHSGPNYLLKEMGYQVARKHAEKLRKLAILLGFLAPVCLCALTLFLPTGVGAVTAVLAALSAQTGIVVERWLFFAEAQHVMGLYYGRPLGAAA
jgi:DMSO reductase anchor subunit